MKRRRRMRLSVLAVLGLFAAAFPSAAVFAQADEKPVAAVWEMWERNKDGSWRLVLFADGTSSDKKDWRLSPTKLFLGKGSFHLSPDRQLLIGRQEGHTVTNGKLVMRGLLIRSKPVKQPKTKTTGSHQNSNASGPADDIPGMYQLQGLVDRGPSKGKLGFSIPVELSGSHRVFDGTELIGTWKLSDNRLSMKFVDSRIGGATLSQKSPGRFAGRANGSENLSWSLKVDRIEPVATAVTDTLGKVTFYSNHYLDAPSQAENHGFWQLAGKKLRLGEFLCTMKPDGRTFSGRGADAVRIKGRIVTGELKESQSK